ncbi:hypothetical protein HYR99_22505 [Candidatus Poribacteria bacterium]|nr:hypothetical protein [Candidatus Poribacteria bacterium]
MDRRNFLAEDVRRIIEEGLHARMRKKRDIKMAITSSDLDGRLRVLVVSDCFRRKSFFDRVDLISQLLEEAGFTPKQRLQVGPIVPLTEREAERTGALSEVMPTNSKRVLSLP